MERIVLTYDKDGFVTNDMTIAAVDSDTRASRVLLSIHRFAQHSKAIAQLNARQIRFIAKLIVEQAEQKGVTAAVAFSKGKHSIELPYGVAWLKKLINEADGRELPTPA